MQLLFPSYLVEFPSCPWWLRKTTDPVSGPTVALPPHSKFCTGGKVPLENGNRDNDRNAIYFGILIGLFSGDWKL